MKPGRAEGPGAGELPSSRRVRISLARLAEGAPTTSARLFHLLADAFGVLALDLDLDRPGMPAAELAWLLEKAGAEHLALSLLLAPEVEPPSLLAHLVSGALEDIVLCPGEAPSPSWREALSAALSWRLRLTLPLEGAAAVAWLELAAVRACRHVEFALGPAEAAHGAAPGAAMRDWTIALEAGGIPWTGHDLPFCVVDASPRLYGALQPGCDLYRYDPEAQDVVEALLKEPHAARGAAIDRHVRRRDRRKQHDWKRWAERAALRLQRVRLARIAYRVAKPVARALLRGLFAGRPRAEGSGAASAPVAPERSVGEPCAACAWQRICPAPVPAALALFPPESRAPVAGGPTADPLAMHRGAEALLPPIDAPRVAPPAPEMIQRALQISQDSHRAQEVSSASYWPEGELRDKMNGTVCWKILRRKLAWSNVLCVAPRPLTLSAFFAGEAEAIGFSFGGNLQLLCPMTREHQRLVLRVGEAGEYALLRDGEAVEPLHVPGWIHRAGRLPASLEPRLAAAGVRRQLMTQQVLVWRGEEAIADAGPIDLSLLVVCTKFARRLALFLRSIAGQRDIDLARVEVLVAHVPGLDGTDDLLDDMRLLWPALRVVPVRFPADRRLAKGFMINQSVRHARGRRVLLTDADIIFPPDVLSRLEREHPDAHFTGIGGRKMLDRRTTAELLLGLRDPVRDFGYLRDEAPGEQRFGEAKETPIGFFQCVLRTHFQEVQYEELPHFEGADMRFSLDIRRVFGREALMSDVLALHLDHSGSQWFGAERHF